MIQGMVLLLLDITLLLTVAVLPMYRTGDEDTGNGFEVVGLPAPRKTGPTRVLVFYAMVLCVAIVVVVLRRPIAASYGDVVSGLVNLVTREPNLSHALHLSVLALVPVLAALDILAFALVLRASTARRIVICLNAVLLIVLTMSVDALLLVISHLTGAHLGPRTLFGLAAHITLGTLVIVRVIFSSFQLPRPTAVPLLRKRWTADGFLALMTVIASGAIAAGFVVIAHSLGTRSEGQLSSFVAYPLLWSSIFLLLLLFGACRHSPSTTGSRNLPIDVIIPAYNEIAGIHLTLRSIDNAATHFGGPVRVIMADDGSEDGTGDVARREMALFRSATGTVVPGRHLGKAAALNTALSHATAEVVVRIDADVVIDPHAFDTLPTWFADPTIGSIGSMTYPRQDTCTWFHRMRLFECLLSFGFTRRSQARVDAIGCIPGTYTAFRRQPVVELGGFVMGMNGEDTDLTMQLGRLGYRVAIDPRLIVYEDVPPTLSEFREQRVRWNRAGMHVVARHSPLRGGVPGPRVWLMFTRLLSMRLTAIARPCVFAYLLALAVLSPTTRTLGMTLLGLYLAASAPIFAAMISLAVRHKFARRIPWLITWWAFTMIRRAFVIDSLFTLPVKPVSVPVLSWSRSKTVALPEAG